jgi:hypothetical protein
VAVCATSDPATAVAVSGVCSLLEPELVEVEAERLILSANRDEYGANLADSGRSGWTADDAQLLREHTVLFESQAEKMVDSWRETIGSQPHLAKWFFTREGEPDDEYKAAV